MGKPLILGALVLGLMSAWYLVRRPNDPVGQLRSDALAAIHPGDAVEDKMRRFANQAAIEAFDYNGILLDWSDNSIQEMDKRLGLLRAHPNFANFSDKDIWGEALVAGAYIGEVCRRNHGGAWKMHDERTPGQEWVLVLAGDHLIFPVGWAYKRLKLGDEDNVWHKYQFSVIDGTAEAPRQ